MSFLDRFAPKPHRERPKETGAAHTETIVDPAFERQFSDTTWINMGAPNEKFPEFIEYKDHGEAAEIFHLTPEKTSDEMPIFFATGYLSHVRDYKDSIQTLYQGGHEMISLNHPKESFFDLTPEQAQLITQFRVPDDAIRKGITILKALDHENTGNIKVIAHSAGAVDAAVAALLDPKQRVKQIDFFCPAGLNKKDSGHMINDLKDNKRLLTGLRDHIGRSDSTWIDYAKKSPRQALWDGLGLMGADIHAIIAELHKKGIGMRVIAGKNDPIFPAHLMRSYLEKEIADGFVYFTELKGDHNILSHIEEAEGGTIEQTQSTIHQKETVI